LRRQGEFPAARSLFERALDIRDVGPGSATARVGTLPASPCTKGRCVNCARGLITRCNNRSRDAR
jgi:hypothetical protein